MSSSKIVVQETEKIVVRSPVITSGETYTDSDKVENKSINVAGANVTEALDSLDAVDDSQWVQISTNQSGLADHLADAGNPHSVKSSQVENQSLNVAGADVTAALDTLDATDDSQWVQISTNQSGLADHLADAANPHSVTAAQAGADPAGSAAAVQSNLDAHVGSIANHNDITIATPAELDLLIVSGGAWINAGVVPRFNGAVADIGGMSVALTTAWQELIPGPSQVLFNNVKTGAHAGRLMVDYSGTGYSPTVFVGNLIVHLSIDIPNSNTLVEITFATNGTAIGEAENIQQSVGTAGNHTAGLVFPLSFSLPFDDLTDTEELSVVARCTPAATVSIESFVFMIEGEAAKLFEAR